MLKAVKCCILVVCLGYVLNFILKGFLSVSVLILGKEIVNDSLSCSHKYN